jgi:hypothetical protein
VVQIDAQTKKLKPRSGPFVAPVRLARLTGIWFRAPLSRHSIWWFIIGFNPLDGVDSEVMSFVACPKARMRSAQTEKAACAPQSALGLRGAASNLTVGGEEPGGVSAQPRRLGSLKSDGIRIASIYKKGCNKICCAFTRPEFRDRTRNVTKGSEKGYRE